MGCKQTSNKSIEKNENKGIIENKQILTKKKTLKDEKFVDEVKKAEIKTNANNSQNNISKSAEIKTKKIFDVYIIVPNDAERFKDLVLPSNTLCSKLLEEIEKRIVKNTEFLITSNGHFLKKFKSYEIGKLSNGSSEFVVDVKYLGLILPDSVVKAYNGIQYIGRPLTNPFDIVIYDKAKATIDFLDKPIGHGFNKLKAELNDLHVYCNGLNTLYISTYTNNNFYMVDLVKKTLGVNEMGMLFPRKLFSMIYIPENYIFMIGGKETRKVEYYDIVRDCFIEHSELEDFRLEPSLALVDHSYLYAFSGFDGNKKKLFNFEKINLSSSDKDWIGAEFVIEPEVNFNLSFFGIAYYSKDEILFIGGYSESEKNYLYNFRENKIQESRVQFIDIDFNEKFLLPLHDAFGGSIFPNCTINDINLVNFDSKRKSLDRIFFEFEKEAL
jgi:hypothetical protein